MVVTFCSLLFTFLSLLVIFCSLLVLFCLLHNFIFWKFGQETSEVFFQVRSSHRSCSVRKGVLRNFVKFTGKHLCQNLFFNKVAGLPATLLKKRLWYRCFPVNFAKFLRTPFLQNTFLRLLLLSDISKYI